MSQINVIKKLTAVIDVCGYCDFGIMSFTFFRGALASYYFAHSSSSLLFKLLLHGSGSTICRSILIKNNLQSLLSQIVATC